METETTKKSRLLALDYEKKIDIFIKNKSMDIETTLKDKIPKNYKEIAGRLFDAINDAKFEWEQQNHPLLDGLTPIQYYDTLNTIEDIIELVSFFITDSLSDMPPNLLMKIKKFDSMSIAYLNDALLNIEPDKDNQFTDRDQTIIKMIQIIALPEFLDNLLKVLKTLNVGTQIFKGVMVTFIVMGRPALDKLIQAVESTEWENTEIKTYFLMSIAEIGKKHKSERIYRLLKEQFRKSDYKVIESGFLAAYGDSRAVTAIREYVERNKSVIPKEEYIKYRKNIIELGGNVNNLDDFFDIDKTDEYAD